MGGAFVYLTACSMRNHLKVRLRRLREPRYLLGSSAGLLYFGLMFRSNGPSSRLFSTWRANGMMEIAAAAMLFIMAAWAWIRFRSGGPVLTFTRAEVVFLVQQFEDLTLHAGAADGYGELDHRHGNAKRAKQGDPEEPAGDENEEEARAEADYEAERGRAGSPKNQALRSGGHYFRLVSGRGAVDQGLWPRALMTNRSRWWPSSEPPSSTPPSALSRIRRPP